MCLLSAEYSCWNGIEGVLCHLEQLFLFVCVRSHQATFPPRGRARGRVPPASELFASKQ